MCLRNSEDAITHWVPAGQEQITRERGLPAAATGRRFSPSPGFSVPTSRLNSPKHSSQCATVSWLLSFLISIFSSQFPKFHVARGLPQFTLHDSPAYKNAQNGYVNERKEGARASGKASCLGVGCDTRHGNQDKAGTSGCSVGGAGQQLSPQRSLSFLPSFCRPPPE